MRERRAIEMPRGLPRVESVYIRRGPHLPEIDMV